MRQVLCDRLARLRRCLGPAKRGKPTLAAVKRSPTPNESRRFEAKLHCCPGRVIRGMTPGRGIPPGCVARRLTNSRICALLAPCQAGAALRDLRPEAEAGTAAKLASNRLARQRRSRS